MPGEYGVRNPDGSVSVIDRDTGREIRRESWEQNQGIPPPGSSPMTVVGGPNPPGGTGDLTGFDQSKGPDGQPLKPGQRWERGTNGNFVFVDPYGGQGSAGWPGGVVPNGGAATPGAGGGLNALLNANALDNTTRLNLLIQQAAQQYALAVTAEERNQAYLDLQRWTAELQKVQNQQGQYTDLAKTILGAASQYQNRPEDYVKYNQIVSGGRDIFDTISGKAAPGAAFGAPVGHVRPGSLDDLLGRLGIQYPQTPATPAGVQPGAANPTVNPGQPTGGTSGSGGGLPSLDEMKSGLRTAGWGGNFDDPNAVADAWWNASPERRGRPRPALPV